MKQVMRCQAQWNRQLTPARGARWGTKYCETHIDAHFGVYRKERERRTALVEPKLKFVGLFPPEHKNAGQLYESYQVGEAAQVGDGAHPYYGNLGDGEKRERWRMMLRLLTPRRRG